MGNGVVFAEGVHQEGVGLALLVVGRSDGRGFSVLVKLPIIKVKRPEMLGVTGHDGHKPEGSAWVVYPYPWGLWCGGDGVCDFPSQGKAQRCEAVLKGSTSEHHWVWCESGREVRQVQHMVKMTVAHQHGVDGFEAVEVGVYLFWVGPNFAKKGFSCGVAAKKGVQQDRTPSPRKLKACHPVKVYPQPRVTWVWLTGVEREVFETSAATRQ